MWPPFALDDGKREKRIACKHGKVKLEKEKGGKEDDADGLS